MPLRDPHDCSDVTADCRRRSHRRVGKRSSQKLTFRSDSKHHLRRVPASHLRALQVMFLLSLMPLCRGFQGNYSQRDNLGYLGAAKRPLMVESNRFGNGWRGRETDHCRIPFLGLGSDSLMNPTVCPLAHRGSLPTFQQALQACSELQYLKNVRLSQIGWQGLPPLP